ncbi:MAG: 5'-3' exonuclease [Solirubrobacteraceae bacterium]
MASPLLVVDTPWLLYRSFFALPAKKIRDAQDRPANALLGSLQALLNAIEQLQPRAVVCCFGAEEAEYRAALYPPYHAHRDPMPAELREQWERAPDLLRAFAWTLLEHPTLEADDVMHSLALVEQSDTLLMTADRDLYQSVTRQARVLHLGPRGAPLVIGEREVRARSGVRPRQIPDLIALRGDPSDGIPGAKGIGAKGAAALLEEHGDLEGVLAAKRLRPRIAGVLAEQAEELRMFKQLATLREIAVASPADQPTDTSAGAAAVRELGLKRLAERLG